MSNEDKAIETLERLYQDLAEADMNDPSLITDDDRRWADEQRRLWDIRIAEASRELLPEAPELEPVRHIRPKYRAMDRRALDATFTRMLSRTGGQLLVAYRNLSELSDDDVRRLLETLDAEPEEP